jgi:hypothetical protein
MTIHRTRHVTLLIATLFPIAALSPSVYASPVIPRQVVAHSPLAAVRATVIGFYTPKYIALTCSTQSPRVVGVWSTCPFTARFRRRVATHGAVQLCPEQYPPRTVKLQMISSTASSARINARWDMGAKLSYTTTFVVIRVKGAWLVDNEYLAGRLSANVYNNATPSLCH